MDSLTKKYQELEATYGATLLRRAMDTVQAMVDDDHVLPFRRFHRTAAWLKGYSRDPDLSEMLADVEHALTGDCGDHRPMLERFRDRLKTALGKPPVLHNAKCDGCNGAGTVGDSICPKCGGPGYDWADDHYTGPRGRDMADITAHSQAEIQRTLKR